MSQITGAWVGGQAYTLGQIVEPRGVTGFGYAATVAGTSGTNEPVWPVVAGGTVADGGVTWTAYVATTITWEAVPLYKSAGVEPVWPTTVGGTVVDGSITWTRTVQNIEDTNCPNTTEVIVMASKVFAVAGDVVKFSATNDPRNWSAPNDAGFLPVGQWAPGSHIAKVLGSFRDQLVVWTASTMQIWTVDPDPANMALFDQFESLGSIWANANAAVGNDAYFLTNLGIRNLQIAAASTNLQAGNIGTPVDPLIRNLLQNLDPDPTGFYIPSQGQYCIAFRELGRTIVAVYTINGDSNSTWSTYEYEFLLSDYAFLNGDLYLRTGDDVFFVDQSVDTDDGVLIEANILWNFLDFGAPMQTKTVKGLDVVSTGSDVDARIYYDQRDRTIGTPSYIIDPDTAPGGIIPLEVTAPSFAPRLFFTGAFELYGLTLYLNDFQVGAA